MSSCTDQFPQAELIAVEAAVRRARQRGVADLRILGWGELSVVIGWEFAEKQWACKRLPPFESSEVFYAYAATLAAYEAALSRAGVPVLPGQLLQVPRCEVEPIVYLVQPAIAREALLSEVVRHCPIDECIHHLRRIIAHTRACTAAQVGLDAQLSNWAISEAELVYFDTTSAFVRDQQGRSPAHADLFVGTLPRPLQGLVRRYLLEEARAEYFDPRAVLRNLLANLFKEGLASLVPKLLPIVNDQLEPVLTLGEVKRCYLIEELRWGSFQLGRRIESFSQRMRGLPARNLVAPRLRSTR